MLMVIKDMNERSNRMEQTSLQQCITECESALGHLNNALSHADTGAKPKMQHAVKDLEECISACRGML